MINMSNAIIIIPGMIDLSIAVLKLATISIVFERRQLTIVEFLKVDCDKYEKPLVILIAMSKTHIKRKI